MIDGLLKRIAADMDRCKHGRQALDECYGCRDSEFKTRHSVGNPHILDPIGYKYTGEPWTVADLIRAIDEIGTAEARRS